MKLYLNASNGGRPLGDAALRIVSEHADGVRVPVPNGLPRRMVRELVRELVSLEAVFIVGGWDFWIDGRMVSDRTLVPRVNGVVADALNVVEEAEWADVNFHIEVGNEPNLAPELFRRDPRTFSMRVNVVALANVMQEHDVSFISGGVSNVHPSDGLAYVIESDRYLTNKVMLGVHPYRMNRHPIDDVGGVPIERIASTIRAKRRFCVTEGGWHVAPRRTKRGFPLCFTYRRLAPWTEEQIAVFAELELDVWERAGAELYAWYQLNSGPDNGEPEHQFGIRRYDGSLRPVADALREWRLSRAA